MAGKTASVRSESRKSTVQQVYLPSAYDQSNIISRNLHLWIWAFLFKHYNRDLNLQDLHSCPHADRSEHLGDKLEHLWEEEMKKSKLKNRKPSLGMCLIRMLGLQYVLTCIFCVTGYLMPVLQALCMGQLITDLETLSSLHSATIHPNNGSTSHFADHGLPPSNLTANFDRAQSMPLHMDTARFANALQLNSTSAAGHTGNAPEEVRPSSDFEHHLRMRMYALGAGVVLTQLLFMLLINPYYLHASRIGMDARVACCSLIYRKSLRLSRSAFNRPIAGQAANLLSNDVNRFDLCCFYVPFIPFGVVLSSLVVYLLWYPLAWNTVGGVSILALYIPLQTMMGKAFGRLRSAAAQLTDERVRLMNEFVPAMRVLKMYTWERPFAALIHSVRTQEVKRMRIASYLRAVNLSLFFVSAKVIVAIVLISWVVSGGQLDARTVFVCMSLMNQVRLSVTLMIPLYVSTSAETRISLKRISAFLALPERSDFNCGGSLLKTDFLCAGQRAKLQVNCMQISYSSPEMTEDEQLALAEIDAEIDSLSGGRRDTLRSVQRKAMQQSTAVGKKPGETDPSVSFENESNNPLEDSKSFSLHVDRDLDSDNDLSTSVVGGFALHHLRFDCDQGQLCAIVGPVGSGKSSVLMAILGEMYVQSGQLNVNGRVSYASQEPWTFAGTIRENILFNALFDQQKYDEVIRVCALQRDLTLFSNGDQTYVGDRGVTLSGGQRARINLARSLYVNADIYLLDDPLSAVDAHVAKHIFEQAIRGYLRNKLVVLVTHQLQFLQHAERILLLQAGRQLAFGDYYTIMDQLRKDTEFAAMLATAWTSGCGPLTGHSATASASNSTTNLHQLMYREPSICSDLATQDPLGSNLSLNSQLKLDESLILTSPLPPPIVEEELLVADDDLEFNSNPNLNVNKSFGSSVPISPAIGRPKDTPVIAEKQAWADSTRVDLDSSTTDPETSANRAQLDENELPAESSTLAASSQAYIEYFWRGNAFVVLLLFMLFVFSQFLYSGTDFWLSMWTDSEEQKAARSAGHFPLHHPYSIANSSNDTSDATDSSSGHWLIDQFTIEQNVYIYSAQMLTLFVVSLLRGAVFFYMCTRSSIRLHDQLFESVVHAPISFFDRRPIGSLLNRCSRDMGIIDEILPSTSYDAIGIICTDIGIMIMLAIVNPWLLIPFVVLAILILFIRRIYVRTARQIKMLEGVARSPVFSQLSASLHGLATIRAFNAQKRFEQRFDLLQNDHSSGWFFYITTARWFLFFMDITSVVFVGGITAVTLVFVDSSNGALVGLIISSTLLFSSGFQWCMKQWTEVETQMTSVDRVHEYSNLESEGGLPTETIVPPADWPTKGQIEFKQVTLRYDFCNKVVLNDLNFTINAGEKIGVVGRTGAGKSSLIAALFRLNECEGSIVIDQLDTKHMPLLNLRSRLAIIPQEPVLFTGTVRSNLDPFNQHSDDRLWQVLSQIRLNRHVGELPGGLQATIADGGGKFSVGQKQLLCLARAMLRGSRVLILDEATANCDPDTDQLIQRTIRTEFAQCTIITIAHRLHTVLDADRVLVLDAGRMLEFDSPAKLLNQPSSRFYSMMSASGKVPHQINQEYFARSKRSDSDSMNKIPNDEAQTVSTHTRL